MAKSLRSKIKMRWRKLKREYVDKTLNKQKHAKIVQTLNAAAMGLEYREKQAKNAFLYPNDPDSKFPQVKPAPIIDLRSTSIPGSGTQWSGGNRKYKIITQQYKNFDQIEAEEVQSESKQEQKQDNRQQKMVEQPAKAEANHKAKKVKKSKLRKTFVF